MADIIERAQAIIDQITDMESQGSPKEHIELIAQEARQGLFIAVVLPPMHPTIFELNELLQKYLVD